MIKKFKKKPCKYLEHDKTIANGNFGEIGLKGKKKNPL